MFSNTITSLHVPVAWRPDISQELLYRANCVTSFYKSCACCITSVGTWNIVNIVEKKANKHQGSVLMPASLWAGGSQNGERHKMY